MLIIILFLVSKPVWGMVEFYSIDVVSFTEKSDNEYVLSYQVSGNERFKSHHPFPKNKIYNVHIRFKKECVTNLLQSKDIPGMFLRFKNAVEILKANIAENSTIEIGLESGKGFHPIPNRMGHFQADNLSLVGNKKVYFVHSDLGSSYCE